MGWRRNTIIVMAGLVPAIHVLLRRYAKKDVDARHKAGHDGVFYELIAISGWAKLCRYA